MAKRTWSKYKPSAHSHPPLARARLIAAEQKAGYWLHLGNLASEKGEKAKAERHYERAQKWQDLMNSLLGNGDNNETVA